MPTSPHRLVSQYRHRDELVGIGSNTELARNPRLRFLVGAAAEILVYRAERAAADSETDGVAEAA